MYIIKSAFETIKDYLFERQQSLKIEQKFQLIWKIHLISTYCSSNDGIKFSLFQIYELIDSMFLQINPIQKGPLLKQLHTTSFGLVVHAFYSHQKNVSSSVSKLKAATREDVRTIKECNQNFLVSKREHYAITGKIMYSLKILSLELLK